MYKFIYIEKYLGTVCKREIRIYYSYKDAKDFADKLINKYKSDMIYNEIYQISMTTPKTFLSNFTIESITYEDEKMFKTKYDCEIKIINYNEGDIV